LILQAKNEGSKLNTTHALNHMEAFYKPVYKDHWPSIRISLLTTSKYCALLNNYHSERDKVRNFLTGLGTYDAMTDAVMSRTNFLQKEKQQEIVEDSSLPLEKFLDFPVRPLMKGVAEDGEKEYGNSEEHENIEPVVGKNTSLYDFIPTKRIYSEKELLQQEIVRTSTFDDSLYDVPVKVIQEPIPTLPEQLKFFVYEKGNVSHFPTPKMKHGNQLGQ
jgi:hypothetical protein